jgi:RNA polymerase sigma factor FliA
MLEIGRSAAENADYAGDLGDRPQASDPARVQVEVTRGRSYPAIEAGAFQVDFLCRELSYLLRRIALRFVRRLPAHVELEELMAAGGEGLVMAVRQHADKPLDELKKLATQRIRGAILDHLRANDYLSRRQRTAVTALQKAKDTLEQAGAPADAVAVAKTLGLSLQKTREIEDRLASVQVTSFSDAEGLARASDTPVSLLEEQQHRERVTAAVAKLPERLQLLMSLYYYEELTYQEISEVLNISRSRICQLHTQAVDLLRRELKDLAVA